MPFLLWSSQRLGRESVTSISHPQDGRRQPARKLSKAITPALLEELESRLVMSVLPVTAAVYSGAVTAGTPQVITGDATLAALTTSQGTFANLKGATANGVVTSNSTNSIGTAPASVNAAATALTANDSVNNLQSGNFQFTNGFDANTRFFILETTPQSSTLGDATTVTLIDASNNAVGTFTLTLAASSWTSSPANTTNTALSTITYTSGQGTLTQKQGAVTFALGDFVGTGNAGLATGIRLSSGTLDPVVVGEFSTSGTFPPLPTPPSLPAAVNVLFVGNSYTHRNIAPVISYNSAAITDANGSGYGGVPGIFKQLTVDAGLNYNVTIEAVSSQTLAWHLANKSSTVFQSKWNAVFLQDQSTTPLPTSRGGNLAGFQNAATSLEQGIHSANTSANVYLYETFARADLTYPAGQTYSGQPIETMGNDLHIGYYGELSLDPKIRAVSPAGDAWLRAIQEGVADRNPYDGIDAGKFSLWAGDNFHASIYGSFLNALVHFGTATGKDPRTLGYEKAASDLGISAAFATILEQIAFETLTNAPVIVPPVLAAPTNLVATAKSTSQIDLTWTAPAGTVTGYNVYRGTVAGGESATPLNTTTLTGTTYQDTTASPATTYYYTVKAVYAAGSSAASNETSATTQGTVSGADLALNRPAFASSVENSTMSAANAVDGKSATRWSSQFSDPQWIYVDLGSTFNITRVKLNWEAASGKNYLIQVSSDATNWTTMATITNNTTSGVHDYTGLSGTGRYVRVYGTARTTPYGYSLYDFNIYGTGGSTTPAPGVTPLVRTGWTATASSTEGGGNPQNVLDGSLSTRWSSGKPMTSGQWFQIDLGAAQTFNRIDFNSGTSAGDYARSYQILVSSNGTDWSTQTPIATGTGTGADINVVVASPVSARFVRIVQTGTSTSWWSIAELNLYV